MMLYIIARKARLCTELTAADAADALAGWGIAIRFDIIPYSTLLFSILT